MINLKCKIDTVEFETPFFTASGTFGYGHDYPKFVEIDNIGAIITKSITLNPRKGNSPPRIVETPCGMLNSIGLSNIGVKKFISEVIPNYNNVNTKIIVNIAGSKNSEYLKVLHKLESISNDIIGYEINISCPNIEHSGMEIGVDADLSYKLISEIRKRTDKLLIVKLSPNVTDIAKIAKSVEDAGADVISAINTIVGMKINISSRRPAIHRAFAGLSGPAIHPIAVAMVNKIYQAVSIPVIGIGGITNANDVIEFIISGATAVQIGTANFRNPNIYNEIIKDLKDYCIKYNINDYKELIGSIKLYE